MVLLVSLLPNAFVSLISLKFCSTFLCCVSSFLTHKCVCAQTVAAFHSLVGLAAAATSIAAYLHTPLDHLDGVHLASIWAGTFIGAITLTGSMVAFGKLQGLLPSPPLKVANANMLNIGMMTGNVAALAVLMQNPSPGVLLYLLFI